MTGQVAHERAEALKERVYVTFTALAVTVAVARDSAHATTSGAALTLLLTVTGTLLAVFVADLTAHMVRESALPSRATLAHLLRVSFGSLGVLVVPMVILGLSALDVMSLGTALRAISLSLVATLVVVTVFAVRRLRVSPGLKAIMLAAMTVLGIGVLTIELMVH